jgi:hypothetical protein
MLKMPATKRLQLKYDTSTRLSSFAFNFYLRHYTMECARRGELCVKVEGGRVIYPCGDGGAAYRAYCDGVGRCRLTPY